MQYNEVLESRTECPFCTDNEKDLIIEETKNCCVLASRAPHAKNHIIIMPHRHVSLVSELENDEWEELNYLVKKWLKIMQEKVGNATLFLREEKMVPGQVGKSGKSIDHLSYNIIPDFKIINNRERTFYEKDEDFIKIVEDIRKEFLES